MAKSVPLLLAILAAVLINASAFDLSHFTHYPSASPKASACFVDAVGRGAGVAPHMCPEGYVKNGKVCSPICKNGFTGDGDHCHMNCPTGFSAIGSDCTSMWSKGCCCSGCCASCPENYTDIGCFCAKSLHRDSYERGPSTHMICGHGQDQVGGLCYPACPMGYVGIGPICWGGNLGQHHYNYTHKCSDVLYASEEGTCHHLHNKLNEINLDRGLHNVCLNVLLGSTVLPITTLESAAKLCGGELNHGIHAINLIMDHTNAHSCNPNSPYKCAKH